MTPSLLRLYPPPIEATALEGLYLNAPLVPSSLNAGLFVYANFVMSLDGRIAIVQPPGRQVVPSTTANPHDWRLLQELAGHADVLILSAPGAIYVTGPPVRHRTACRSDRRAHLPTSAVGAGARA
ncbi:MAG: hypothetical protein L0H63_04415 [Nitrococcus sp.]|nr:hypothetical protein [Nitrococcus sp.]